MSRFRTVLSNLLLSLLGDKGISIANYIFFVLGSQRIKPIIKKYIKQKNRIIERIKSQDSITVLFFVYNLSMWKYDGLIRLMKNSSKFRPIIVPFVLPNDVKSPSCRSTSDSIVDYCIRNDFEYRIGYDFESNLYDDFNDIKPDIVIYTQPYDVGYRNWKIHRYLKRSLFVYTPYGISIAENKLLRNTILSNISWKIFCSNELEGAMLIKDRYIKKNNTVVTGTSLYDDIKNSNPNESPWFKDNRLKIIWAPHHSIDNKNSYSSSVFEDICDFMIDVAMKYREDIQIAFKPHPVLYSRLVEKWGFSKTKQYYDKWSDMPNTFVASGPYSTLFAFSDALIHDCSSFTAEYLLVNKPVLYLCKEKSGIPKGVDNELGRACFDCNYHGYSHDDIIKFIDAVLRNIDSMREKRDKFVQSNFIPPNNNSVAQNMMNELMSLIEK